MRAGGVGLGVGTANDRAWERDEELHLKGVRVEEQIPHRLSSNLLLPTTQQLLNTSSQQWPHTSLTTCLLPVVAHEDDLRPISLVIGIGTHNPTILNNEHPYFFLP